MPDIKGPIAISIVECKLYGCPYCGHKEGYNFATTGNTNLIQCAKCDRGYSVVYGGETTSTVGSHCVATGKTIYPEVQPHPRANLG